jgi:hypothetical protein
LKPDNSARLYAQQPGKALSNKYFQMHSSSEVRGHSPSNDQNLWMSLGEAA